MEFFAFALFIVIFAFLMVGYPVAFTLAGVSLAFAFIGVMLGYFEPVFLEALPNRLFAIMGNEVLIAVPLFVFMGVTLQKSRVAEELLDTMGLLFGSLRGGLGASVVIVGMLMAASTGIVGATVVTMGLLSLPVMLKRNYNPAIATGTICASGTLGQLIPPSIVLILLGDVMSTAYQQSQLARGEFSPDTVSVGDLFLGALLPGLILVGLYLLYIIWVAFTNPAAMPAIPLSEREKMLEGTNLFLKVIQVLMPPIILIVLVLGSILAGYSTPTEAASVGCVGALVIALAKRRLSISNLNQIVRTTAVITSQVFFIFIGASFFSLVFRGYGGDIAIEQLLLGLPGDVFFALLLVMLVIFLLGFFLDFIEITVIIVPTVAPVLLSLGLDPLWLGVMIALNLQTSFLTPPFGFSLFYLRSVTPQSVKTIQMYKGVMPFIALQLVMLVILWIWPQLATYLPHLVYDY